jgi:NADPH-dependent 2,4-dienoyl-CoA reductase/sulfur reductase-like enzyme
MTGQPEHVLVIGAGLGGVRTAEQLRSAGFQGRISLVGAEPHVPYDRPPLSKQILTGAWEPGRAILRTLDQLEDLGVRAHLGLPAVAMRPGAVELADGSTLHGDAVVIATGLVARRLPGQPTHVHTLRTLDDALELRATLDRIDSLLILGGGFIGAEVASAARARGIAVTVLETLPEPVGRALGPAVGALAGRLFVEAGVDLRTGVTPAGFVTSAGFGEGGDRVAVELTDGTRIEADAGLVGIGGLPWLDWLDGFPPPTFGTAAGLRCDASGRVHGWDSVWAVGDVAAWDDPDDGTAHRDEHWTSAGDQAAVVARDILGAPPLPVSVPYFWSDQFGLKIQLLGRPDRADGLLPLHGTGFDGGPVRGTVAGYLVGERLAGVVGFGAARFVARYRALLAARASRDEAVALASALEPVPSPDS